MTNVLITGGAGYIGSKLATRLVNLNFNVTVIDILKFTKNSLNHLFYSNNFNFIKGKSVYQFNVDFWPYKATASYFREIKFFYKF